MRKPYTNAEEWADNEVAQLMDVVRDLNKQMLEDNPNTHPDDMWNMTHEAAYREVGNSIRIGDYNKCLTPEQCKEVLAYMDIYLD